MIGPVFVLALFAAACALVAWALFTASRGLFQMRRTARAVSLWVLGAVFGGAAILHALAAILGLLEVLV